MIPTICPNCGSAEVATNSGGRLLPFFVKRVFGIEPPTLATFLPHRIGAQFTRLTRNIPALSRLGHAWPLQCEILICTNCDFVCPALEIGDGQLLHLYHDYRSAGYNAERIRYEPSYRKLAPLVGKSSTEYRSRMEHVEAFLSDVPAISLVRNVLDFAGADGRFVPPSLLERCDCTVYEVSEELPCRPEIRKTSQISQLGEFDYIQVCHLLEHVLQPKVLVETVARYLRKGGLIYIEVPMETSEQHIQALRAGTAIFPIHEHINLYSEKSLAALVESVGLKLVKMGTAELNIGWCRATVLSAVASSQNA